MATVRSKFFSSARSQALVRGWGVSLVLAGVVGASGCGIWQDGEGPSGQAVAEEMVAVDAALAEAGIQAGGLSYTGTTRPSQQVTLRSRVDGQVTLLAVDVGDAVTEGEALARLDADLLSVEVNQTLAELQARQSEVAQAQASVSDAQTALETARVQLQQAQTDATRLARLAANGAISLQDAEQAQLAVDTAQQVLRSAEEQIRTRQEAVSAAQGRVEAQRAVVNQAQERLSYAIVQSPLSGVVIDRSVETGDYVESGDPIVQIGDLSSLEVMIEISDLDLSDVQQAQPVEVQLDAFPDQTLTGIVTRIAPAADPTSRLVPVEITVDNPTGRFGSGLLARVSLMSEDRDRVAIPADALDVVEADGAAIAVVNSEDGNEATVEVRRVDIGRELDGQVEILSGLRPGEAFVTRSSGPLSDGQTVRLSILSETGTRPENI